MIANVSVGPTNERYHTDRPLLQACNRQAIGLILSVVSAWFASMYALKSHAAASLFWVFCIGLYVLVAD